MTRSRFGKTHRHLVEHLLSSGCEPQRRRFLKSSMALALGGVLPSGLLSRAFANHHPHPHEGSIDFLDRDTYIHDMEVLLQFEAGKNRRGDLQFMCRGKDRFLFQLTSSGCAVYDITKPLQPSIINEGAFEAQQIQLAYNRMAQKWLVIAAHHSDPPNAYPSPEFPNGRYDDPRIEIGWRDWRGLRGVKIWDATDPTDMKLLSEYSTDGGDPSRELQEGMGVKESFYTGGKYCFLDTSPDNTFVHMETPLRYYSNALQIIDVEDPEKPKFVSNTWLPGQRTGEESAYKEWPEYGDKASFTGMHSGTAVPVNIEDGGRYGYSAFGALGMQIHDFSKPAKPRLVGRFDPPSDPGAIVMHTVDVTRIDTRGIVIVEPEAVNPDCNEPQHPIWIIDVTDPSAPKPISQLPRPIPPQEAPYQDFCDKRGRFGTHAPPAWNAPGKVSPNLTMYPYFIAGLQCFDITNLAAPGIAAYFIPPQAGDLAAPGTYHRTVDHILVEWDRRLIWAGTDTGVYLLSTPHLGDAIVNPMPVTEWSLPGSNIGHA